MNDIAAALDACFTEALIKFVLSNPTGPDGAYKKVTGSRAEDGYRLERLTATQAFHSRASYSEVRAYVGDALGRAFKQFNGWDDRFEYAIRISKKGKALTSKRRLDAPPDIKAGNDREKQYILREGVVAPPLIDMGILTREGAVVRSMHAKFRQINRFVEMVDDEAARLPDGPITVIDFGCGKSYLTFVLYHYFTEILKRPVHMIGLDLKRDVIEKCNETARRYRYEGLRFEVGDIAGYQCDRPVDMVVALHACDTATDHALFSAVRWGAKLIFSVPCCQHELSGQISSGDMAILTHYGVVKERLSALMTDAVRAHLLTACGYRTQVLEFIDLEHTPKNLMIRARRAPLSEAKRGQALAEVERLMDAFSLNPTLYTLLARAQYIKKRQP